MPQKKMDFSTDQGRLEPRAGSGKPLVIRLPKRPLSPWLRLAHLSVTRPNEATHRARLRVLRDFELVFQCEGSGWIGSQRDRGSVDVPAGAVAFIPPGFVHGWASEPGAHIAVHFDLHAQPGLAALRNIRPLNESVTRAPLRIMPRFALRFGGGGGRAASSKQAARPEEDPGWIIPLVSSSRAPGLWRERLEPLVQLLRRRGHTSLPARFLAAETISWALRELAAQAAREGLAPPPSADPRILALLQALEAPGPERHGQRPSIRELAGRAGMGETAFRLAFRQATGRGPRRYLEERRVEEAARLLLETGLRAAEIARRVGYDDPYHFSRVFKRVQGVAPRPYRRRARRGAQPGKI